MCSNLKKININVTKDMVYLFYKQYDSNLTNKLEYPEFVNSLIPFEQDYRSALNNRKSTGNKMSSDTLKLLKKTYL